MPWMEMLTATTCVLQENVSKSKRTSFENPSTEPAWAWRAIGLLSDDYHQRTKEEIV